MKVLVKKLTPSAQLLFKKNPEDAGWDIFADNNFTLYPGKPQKISTGIALAIEEGYYGQIFDRSGLGSKGIHVLGGVIDSEYRGEVVVCLINLNKPDIWVESDTNYICSLAEERLYYDIHAGDRIAQIVFLPVPKVGLEEVDELPESVRGENGFGSSGR